MKKPGFFWMTAVSLIAMAALASGCGNILGGGKQVAGKTATVTIGVPAVSPLLAQAFAAATGSKAPDTKAPASKAMLFATGMQIIVYDATTAVEVVNSGPIDSSAQAHPGDKVSCSFNLTIGSTYYATMYVWNTNTSYSSYILTGSSSNFTVQSGTNDVGIILLPQYYTALSDSASYSVSSSVYSSAANSFTTIGGECWYRFSATGEVMKIVATPELSSDCLYVALFDEKGQQLIQSVSPSLSGGTDASVTIVTGLTTGSYYYLGLIEIDTTGLESRSGSIAISDVSSTGDESYSELDHEPNDTGATGFYAMEGMQIQGTAYDVDWFYFNASSTATIPIWFSFSTTTYGSMGIYLQGATEPLAHAENYSEGQKLFSVSADVTSGNTYYIRGDFYEKAPTFGFETHANGYTLGVGLALPSNFASPSLSGVNQGKLLVNQSNPSAMTYLVRTSANNLYSFSSLDGGASWGSALAMDESGYVSDFAGDMDSYGNAVAIWTTSANGSSNSYIRYSKLASGASAWDANGSNYQYVNCAQTASPGTTALPSAHRPSDDIVLLGAGYDSGGGGAGNDTAAMMVRWDGDVGAFTYPSMSLNVGVDNPVGINVFEDSGGNMYYLNEDCRFDWSSSDIAAQLSPGGYYETGYNIVDSHGTNVTNDWSDAYAADQPWIFQRTDSGTSTYLVVYSGSTVNSTSGYAPWWLYAKTASSFANLVGASSTLIAGSSGSVSVRPSSSYDGSSTSRTLFCDQDMASGDVYAVFQNGVDGSVYYSALSGSTFSANSPLSVSAISSDCVLDGASVANEGSTPVLYISYHDASGNAGVKRIVP